MIIDTHLHPTNLVDEAWRHTGEPFTGGGTPARMSETSLRERANDPARPVATATPRSRRVGAVRPTT